MMEKQRSLLPGIRPTPDFAAVSPFSQRKRSPFRAVRPPKAPAKSCPPVSRIFPTPKHSYGPQVVSFKSERTQDGESVSLYSIYGKTGLEGCGTSMTFCTRGGHSHMVITSQRGQEYYFWPPLILTFELACYKICLGLLAAPA